MTEIFSTLALARRFKVLILIVPWLFEEEDGSFERQSLVGHK